MRIVSINGSPKGKSSNTNVMLQALLRGLRSPDTEVHEITLAEKEVRYCRGCYTCWTKTPGRCVIDDDMNALISLMQDTDLFLIGSPLYFNNISGTLKVFIDRLTAAGGNPHDPKDRADPPPKPRFVMVSNCGFPYRSQFAVVSLWVKAFVAMMQGELIAEFYTTDGKVLTQADEGQAASRTRYLAYLEQCGRRILDRGELAPEHERMLDRNILDF